MDLRKSLRQAAADPPPTAIDLDRLIADTSRVDRRRRWLATVGPAAAIAIAVIGTIVLVPAGQSVPTLPSTSPTVTPSRPADPCGAVLTTPTVAPTAPARAPTEPVPAALSRLSDALTRRLSTTLPDAVLLDPFHPACGRIQFEANIAPWNYYAVAEVTDSAGQGGVEIILDDEPVAEISTYPERTTLPDGTEVAWNRDAPTRSGEQVNQVMVVLTRPDGTWVMLISVNVMRGNYDVITRPSAPATVEQLIAIGTDPAFTLYPS